MFSLWKQNKHAREDASTNCAKYAKIRRLKSRSYKTHSHIEVFQAVCQLGSLRPSQPCRTTKAPNKWDYWAGGGVGFWVGGCFICLIKFERQIDSLDLVDGGRCARILVWENELIDKKRKKTINIRSDLDVRHFWLKRTFAFFLPASTPSASASPSRCIFWCKRSWQLHRWRTIPPHKWKTGPRSLRSRWRQKMLTVNKWTDCGHLSLPQIPVTFHRYTKSNV